MPDRTLPDHEWIKASSIPSRIPVSDTTVRRMIQSGKLPATRFGRTTLVKRADYEAAFEPVTAA